MTAKGRATAWATSGGHMHDEPRTSAVCGIYVVGGCRLVERTEPASGGSEGHP
jgi:hypothetical protein